MNRRPALVAALVAALSLGLAACSSSGSAPDGEPAASADAPDADSPRAVTIGALSISETAPLWAAVEAGVFAEHGLDVTVQPIQGGAQAMPALINGDIDFSVGQPFGAMRASLQGLDVKIVANYAQSLTEGDDINSVVVGAGSDITSPADLAGKKVAVNSLGAAGDLTIMAAVEEDGGDPSTVEFVEVAFPDAQAQLEAGNIDAAWVPEPFVSMIVGSGGARVVDPYQAVLPGLPTLVLQTTGTTVADDPELVEAVREAFTAAFAWAAENDETMRQSLVTEMSLPDAAAANLRLPQFSTEIDEDVLQGLADLAVEHEFFDTAPDLDELVSS
ncbi:ABC transporter substrate-binding protein [Cellulomonas sp. zg-ZUI222]|uniref:ABC transporter substrate-binding protein n=1 Tax=Cellulomonas wangleii TaxID=2816956 RepID=UPI001A94E5B2|nr:ABC transporter substrate-binding protein [Cellulomonas wangleii]MBO0922100.1 ABC transporter substrate-binding protein [Cellulomonas wangleii]